MIRLFLVSVVVMVSVVVGCGGAWDGSVGAIFGKDNRNGRVFVREVPAGLAASQAGVAEGDELTKIDGKPVAAMTPDEVHRALAGKVGSKVTLELAHDGASRSVTVERGPLLPGHPPAEEEARPRSN